MAFERDFGRIGAQLYCNGNVTTADDKRIPPILADQQTERPDAKQLIIFADIHLSFTFAGIFFNALKQPR
jgi:hypothetical protein